MICERGSVSREIHGVICHSWVFGADGIGVLMVLMVLVVLVVLVVLLIR